MFFRGNKKRYETTQLKTFYAENNEAQSEQ